jgi:hypothetical protein
MVNEQMKPRLKSEFSMGQLDFERFHEMLQVLDKVAVRARMFESDSVIPFYSILKELYKNWRPIVFITKRQKIDETFDIVEREIIEWRNAQARKFGGANSKMASFPIHILRKLEDIQTDILEIKQVIGLGIKVEKDLTQKKKWERALGVSHD